MSKTHKVGGVYGLQGVPNITAQAGGFRICATKAGAKVTILYIKDMEDAAEAKEAALSLIEQGADVITGKLNAAEAGLVEAAKEKNVVGRRGAGRPDQDRARTRAHQHRRGLAGDVRQHRRSGQGGQAVRNVRPIRLRHRAGHRRHAAIRAGQGVQSDRARRGRRRSSTTWRRSSRAGALKITPTENDARSGS